MDKRVNSYIEKLPSPQREICMQVRQIILDTAPQLQESFKNGVPWYEDLFYLVGLKHHVNVGFAIKNLSSEELALFQGRGKLMRHVKIASLDDIDEGGLIRRIHLVTRSSGRSEVLSP